MSKQKDSHLLNFIEEGAGKITLVFLHYFGGSAQSWSFVVKELKKYFRCIAIDLCGFGNSHSPSKQLSVKDSADDVIGLIKHLQLENYVLIGHSMGGKIALSIAAGKPENLQSLILIAPSPPTPEPMSAKARKDLLNTFGKPEAIKKLIKKNTVQPLEENIFKDTVADHLKVTSVAWSGWVQQGSLEDISSEMPEINVPVFVISSSFDPNFPTSFLKKELLQYFSYASFHEIAGAGHLLPVEVPSLIVKSIMELLKTDGVNN